MLLRQNVDIIHYVLTYICMYTYFLRKKITGFGPSKNRLEVVSQWVHFFGASYFLFDI